MVQVSALLLAVAVTGVMMVQAASKSKAQSTVKWDPAQGQELAAALEQLHHAWNNSDVAALEKAIIGDDVLVTFELDPETNQPVRLQSKEQLEKFTRSMVSSYDKAHIRTVAEHPKMACKASGGLGICTEECTVKLYLENGKVEEMHLYGTNIAVRQDDGWKFIQWHMSQSAPTEVVGSAGGQ